MSLVLLIVGIVVAAAGIATIGFGIPINEFSLGTTLIITGTTALTGGLILIGLSVVVMELGRVAEGLKARSASRAAAAEREAQEPRPQPRADTRVETRGEPRVEPAVLTAPPIPPPAPAPAASQRPPPSIPARPVPEAPVRPTRPAEPFPATPSAVEVSAAAIERLRSSIPRTERPRADASTDADIEDTPLSPNGAAQRSAPAPRAPEAAPAPPRAAAEDRASGAAVEALKASRLDFLFRSKPAARPAPQPDNFDGLWAADASQGRAAPRDAEPQPRTDRIERQSDLAPPPQDHARERRPETSPAAVPPAPGAAILKSGIVDGMAYTLYADGSIEAKLPHGMVRFGSIAELRAHIESNS
jgi:hypothetical protein